MAPRTQPIYIQKPDPWYLKFHNLMPHRIREILLVSSAYDAFVMEEDGRLTDRIFTGYSELNLSEAPRITHAPTAGMALRMLQERRIDLVISVVEIEDVGLNELGRQVKALRPDVPVILLLFGESDLARCPGGVDPDIVQHVLLWNGDTRVLIAGTKVLEDAQNVQHDVQVGDVQVIVVVEDSVRYSSTFLSLLYAELLQQSRSLIAEGLNALHKLMRMRARPKILLARTWEEAIAHIEGFPANLFAVVSDVRFPRDGELVDDAGFQLIEWLRSRHADLPVLMQSSEPSNRTRANELGATYVDKGSPTLANEIRLFLRAALGFGPFIFRMPDRREIGRAADVFEMERVLESVDAASIEYHARRHDFSLWLRARSMFPLAREIRPHQFDAFGDVEEVRRFIRDVLRRARLQQQSALITEFGNYPSQGESAVVRLGLGSVGGKGRSIAFLHAMLGRHRLAERFEGLEITAPRTVVIGTGEYDRCMSDPPLPSALLSEGSDEEITTAFLERDLSDDLRRDLRSALFDLEGPLAVRSSSLLEDSRFQPFAGIYSTFVLPNDHPDYDVRFEELCRAIKAVYASTFSSNARTYLRGTPYASEDEKMAVVVQEMVGGRHGDLFYPHMAGVAQSRNYYPLGAQTSGGGVVHLALGLGHIVVSGGIALRFSPECPEVLPQFSSARDQARRSQTYFCALDMSRKELDFIAGCDSNLLEPTLDVAEAHGTLQHVASVYRADNDVIRDDLRHPGARVVTFNNILRYHAIPLADALSYVLRLLRRAVGSDVEMEFAVDLGHLGQPSPGGGRPRIGPRLYLLQVRPMASAVFAEEVDLDSLDQGDVLARTSAALGHGVIRDLRDVVYVTAPLLSAFTTPAIARSIGRKTQPLRDAKQPYLLIGPGRWGTSDPALGVPVDWRDIAGAGAIAETPFPGRDIEPSQGSHFLHNITAARIGYLTLLPSATCDGGTRLRAWLDAQEAVREADGVRHVRLEQPLEIFLDGKLGTGAVVRTRPPDDDLPV